MTEKDRNRVVYWMLLKHYQWHMYIAATTEGLCYVGSHNAPFVEMERWVNKKLQGHSLVEDVDAMKPYAEELIDYLEGRRKKYRYYRWIFTERHFKWRFGRHCEKFRLV